ncbi:uncharacterized protein TRIADDRAFT_28362 [Trichoplax adhaerens]|uniref:Phosphodiesterase n=1 Tax=Trichoplax adhaerens TaxID=10228 RepID=B3S3C5_TRIAD|nr:hypothetical protein TRIADDRAFT_28362 [Trichoplax adhaerens]EDV22768.1 hypothetical protein TRIADDRAFT_28362 [Trichoplax adhaerens]|eukprot:XP_002114634.1 hypothetical protein TRIADDRAFT_28362 [Trichoplax adhaerens]
MSDERFSPGKQILKPYITGSAFSPAHSLESFASVNDDHDTNKYDTAPNSLFDSLNVDSDELQSNTYKEQYLKQLDEHEMFMELIKDISEELDMIKLTHKILVNVNILTNSDRCSLFLVRGSNDRKVLVSKLFDITSNSILDKAQSRKEIRVPFGKGIAGTTAATGEVINIVDVYNDCRFYSEIDKNTGYRTKSILCMPIKKKSGEVIGVAQVINKKNGEEKFTAKDEKVQLKFSLKADYNLRSERLVFQKYLVFCAIGIANADIYETSLVESQRNRALLELAHGIFEEQHDMDRIIHTITVEARQLLNCRRCTIFLVDNDIHTSSNDISLGKVYDLDIRDGETKEKIKKVRCIPGTRGLYIGLVKQVARTGKTINIALLHNDENKDTEKFDKEFNENVLCMPIFGKIPTQKSTSIAQLVNKLDGMPFDSNDENLFEAFAIFCGLGIYNCLMFTHVTQLLAKQNVALEVLSYHASASPTKAKALAIVEIPPAMELNLTDFGFDDALLDDHQSLLSSLRMFLDCGFAKRFKIPKETLCRWILSVKKNYRSVCYHNWRHAFNVAQMMFTIMQSTTILQHVSKVEAFALLIACFCHDLDHRGTSNSFELECNSPLAKIYGTSTMEHHHFDYSLMILNSENNNILAAANDSERREILNIMEHAVVSTDLALHLKERDQFLQLLRSRTLDLTQYEHRKLLRAMLMTVCDLGAITKPWHIQYRVAQLVAEEFFTLGDMARHKLNKQPTAMLDRNKRELLPKMQIKFIDNVCIPIYEVKRVE